MKFDVIGGISSDLLMTALPWFALTLAVCLGAGLSLLNYDLVRTVPEQNVVAAVCCVAGAGTYLIYMVVNRLLTLFLRSISYRHDELGVRMRRARDGADGNIGVGSVAVETIAEDNEGVEYADVDAVESDDTEEVALFTPPEVHTEDVVLREEMIASMYMGGAGAFLAIPALCMWDMTITVAFILSLQVCAVTERVKVLEYKPNVDRVTAINGLRALHWVQHVVSLCVLAQVMWLDTVSRNEPVMWQSCALATCSPPLLMLGCQHWPSNKAVGLSPTRTLESGLPVSTLLAILVLCWYSPVEAMLEREVVLSKALCFLIMAPPALGVIIAFILRGFRRSQTIGVIVVLTTLTVVRRMVFYNGETNIGLIILIAALIIAAVMRAIHRRESVACDELSYAEVYRRQKHTKRVSSLKQHTSPYED